MSYIFRFLGFPKFPHALNQELAWLHCQLGCCGIEMYTQRKWIAVYLLWFASACSEIHFTIWTYCGFSLFHWSAKHKMIENSLGTRLYSDSVQDIFPEVWAAAIHFCRPHMVTVRPCEYKSILAGSKVDREADIKNIGFLSSLISFPTISLSSSLVQQTFSALRLLTQEGVSHTQTSKSALWQLSPALSGPKERERNLCFRQEERAEDICPCALFCIPELRLNSKALLKWLANRPLCSNWPWWSGGSLIWEWCKRFKLITWLILLEPPPSVVFHSLITSLSWYGIYYGRRDSD